MGRGKMMGRTRLRRSLTRRRRTRTRRSGKTQGKRPTRKTESKTEGKRPRKSFGPCSVSICVGAKIGDENRTLDEFTDQLTDDDAW